MYLKTNEIIQERRNIEMTKKSFSKHLLHIGICCGIPLLILFLLPAFYSLNPKLGSLLSWVTPFICPLMMLPMMVMMIRNDKSCCKKEKD